MTAKLEDSVAEQLSELAIPADRPLIISDADEVLLTFVEALERFFQSRGNYLKTDSFRITGNVHRQDDDSRLSGKEVKAELDAFFSEGMHLQSVVDGAVDALAALSIRATVLVLTNVPLAQRSDRQERLASFGIDYPVIANSGMKGPAVAVLAAQVDAPVFFLDDLPPNLTSVKDAAPDVHRLHFMADDRLRKMVPQADFATAFFDNWREIHDHIAETIDEWEQNG